MKLIEIEPARSPKKERSNWQERDMGSILDVIATALLIYARAHARDYSNPISSPEPASS